MKREIKFRGKSLENGEWLYGDLVRSFDMERSAILVNDKTTYDECKVDTETVGQFTGLHDKNGKEIYEGDILRFGNSPSNVCEVKWNKSIAAFCIRFYFENKLGSNTLGAWLQCEKNIAIIGNIHDNGKLL